MIHVRQARDIWKLAGLSGDETNMKTSPSTRQRQEKKIWQKLREHVQGVGKTDGSLNASGRDI